MVKKRIFAVLCAVVVIALSVVPCFAAVDNITNWGQITFTSDYTEIQSNELTRNTYNRILQCVDNAYKLGLFGGQYPVAVTSQITNTNDVYIYVYCAPCGQPVADNSVTKSQFYYSFVDSAGLKIANAQGGTPRAAKYILTVDGQWSVLSSTATTQALSASNTGNKCIATRALGGLWEFTIDNADFSHFGSPVVTAPDGGAVASAIQNVFDNYEIWLEEQLTAEELESMLDNAYQQGFNDGEEVWWQGGYNIGYDEGYDAGYGEGLADGGGGSYDEGYGAGFEDGYNEGYNLGAVDGYDEGYEAGYNSGLSAGDSILLDIPSIFDSMFAGVRSIMSAFDVEIFGISIIGTLVAVLVITIVAFVVRKLWK